MLKRAAAALGVLCFIAAVSASGQTSPTEVTIWNGTRVLLNFGYESSGQSASVKLASNNRTVLPCAGSAHLSIATGDAAYQTDLVCGGSYGLYYDEYARQFAVRVLPGTATTSVPSPSDQQTPLQELLTNRGAAARNRANLGISAAPKN